VHYKSSMCNKTKDVQDVLDVSGSLTIKAMSGNGGGISGKYIDSLKENTETVTFVIKVDVWGKKEYLDVPQVKPGPFVDAAGPDFFKIYGDSFVSELYSGGSLFATVECTFSDAKKAKTIKANANFQYNIVSGTGDFNKEFAEMTKDATVNIEVTWNGGKIPEVPTTIEALQETAKKYPATVRDNPALIFGITTPYDAIPGLRIDPNISRVRTDINNTVADKYSKWVRFERELNDTLRNIDLYESPNFEEMGKLWEVIKVQKQQIVTWWSNASNGSFDLNFTTSDNVLDPYLERAKADPVFPKLKSNPPRDSFYVLDSGVSELLNTLNGIQQKLTTDTLEVKSIELPRDKAAWKISFKENTLLFEDVATHKSYEMIKAEGGEKKL